MYGQRTEPLFVDSGELGAPNKAIEKYTSDTLIRAILEKWELKVPNHETSEKTLAYWTTINEATRKEFLDLFNSNHSKVKTILGDAVCKWILSDLENHKTRSELSQYRIIVNRLSKESAIDESAKEVLLQEIETYMNGGLPETRLEIMQESRQTNNEPTSFLSHQNIIVVVTTICIAVILGILFISFFVGELQNPDSKLRKVLNALKDANSTATGFYALILGIVALSVYSLMKILKRRAGKRQVRPDHLSQ